MDTIIKLLDKNLDYIKHTVKNDTIYIEVISNRIEVNCPYCGHPSSKVHSKYTKTFQDMPIGDKKVIIKLYNRKMFCNNTNCSYKTFAEKFEFLAEKAKKTNRLQKKIINLSINVSSITASKILSNEVATISKSTICELLKKNRSENK